MRNYDKQMKQNGSLIVAALSELSLTLKHLRKTELRYETLAPSASAASDHGNGDTNVMIRTGDIAEPERTVNNHKPGPSKGASQSISEQSQREALIDALQVRTGPPLERRGRKGWRHIMAGFSSVGKVATQPERFIWAVRDKEKFRENLLRITELVDFLLEMLDRDQMEILVQSTNDFKLLLLQLTGDVSQMKALLAAGQQQEAVNESTSSATLDGSTLVDSSEYGGPPSESTTNTATSRSTAFWIAATRFSISMSERAVGDVTFQDSIQIKQGTADGARMLATSGSKRVWVEWRPFSTELKLTAGGAYVPQVPTETVKRVQRLTALLHAPDSPAEFCVPHCMGYFQDKSPEKRFGLVFEPPAGAADQWPLHSLLEWFNKKPAPLSVRMNVAQQLARWLLYLHAVNWLHKGFRSASVLFFPSTDLQISRKAYISDFEYAALYTHPDYLGPKRQLGFRKSYDIYSLGIVLVELAYWQRIDCIPGVLLQQSARSNEGEDDGQASAGAERGDPSAIQPSGVAEYPVEELAKTRSRILGGELGVLEHVLETMGDKYHSATKACLEGMTAFGLSENANQVDPQVGAMLQQAFIEEVVETLDTIST